MPSFYAKELLDSFVVNSDGYQPCKTSVIPPTLLGKSQVYYWTKHVKKLSSAK
jgi:hypothetical protein